MGAMVGSSLFSVCWAIFALFMVAYMVAIFFMQAIADHVQTSNTDDEWRQHADSRYGSMHRSLLTLMASFSGGLDWLQAAENLETVGWAYVAVFLFYILFVLIGLLNIVTGVFVESAKNMAQLDSDLVIEQELHQSNSWTNQLKLILKGGNEMEHVLTEENLNKHLRNKVVEARLKSLDVDLSDARGVFQLLKSEDTDSVDIDEFIMAMPRLHGSARAVDMVTLIHLQKKSAQQARQHIQTSQKHWAAIKNLLTLMSAQLAMKRDAPSPG